MKRITCVAGIASLLLLGGQANATVVFDMEFTVADHWINAPGGPLMLGVDGVAGGVMVAPPPPGAIDVFTAFPSLFASPNPGINFLAAGWVEFEVTNTPDLTFALANPGEVVSWDIGFDASGFVPATPLPASASLTVQQDATFQDMFGPGWIVLDGAWNATINTFPVGSSTGPTYLSAWTQGPPAPGTPGYILFATADPNLAPLVFLNPNGSMGVLAQGLGHMTATAEPIIPEPGTLALLGLGLTGLLGLRRARR